MNTSTVNPLGLVLWTIVLFAPIYFALLGGLYLVRRYLPEASTALDMPIESLLVFPAVVGALVIALVITSR